MGLGIAVALALDATIVRLLLIPAAMCLIGGRNWYLPRWLEWLPDVEIEGKQPAAPKPRAPRDDEPQLPPTAIPVGS